MVYLDLIVMDIPWMLDQIRGISVGSDWMDWPSVPTGVDEPWTPMILSLAYQYVIDSQCYSIPLDVVLMLMLNSLL